MNYKTEGKTTYGVASSASGKAGSFEADGSRTISNAVDYGWYASSEMRRYKSRVKEGLYRYCSYKEGYCYAWEWRPIGHQRGKDHKVLSTRPKWSKCDPYDNGPFVRNTGSGLCVQVGWRAQDDRWLTGPEWEHPG